jgi:hypothetical protein
LALEDVTDPAIEALDHPFGLRRARWVQLVFNPEILAQHVKFMIST